MVQVSISRHDMKCKANHDKGKERWIKRVSNNKMTFTDDPPTPKLILFFCFFESILFILTGAIGTNLPVFSCLPAHYENIDKLSQKSNNTRVQ